MTKSQEYSVEVTAIYFWRIDFIERERNGPMIPLSLTTVRSQATLGISEKPLFNLNVEIK